MRQMLAAAGFSVLRPVQEQAFDAFQTGKDLYVQARTGSGKTAAYLLPVLNDIRDFEKETKALVIAPTRELAFQITRTARQLAAGRVIRTACLTGGNDRSDQEAMLRQSPQLIIATAGRLLELLEQGLIRTDSLASVILDEADQLLDLGQKDEVAAILSFLPPVRTALLSATMNETLAAFLKEGYLTLVIDAAGVNPDIRQYYCIREDAFSSLPALLASLPVETALVFFNFRSDCEKAAEQLRKQGILAGVLTGQLSQKKRTAVLKEVREGKIRVLCTSDVASRGLDLPGISHVLHIGIPFAETDYIHRSGRSMHSGGSGVSLIVLSPEEAESEAGRELARSASPLEPGGPVQTDLTVPLTKKQQETPLFTRYYIRAGRQDGIRIKDIIGALCTIVPFAEIGTVTVLTDHTVAEVRACNNLPDKLKIKGTIRRIETLKNEYI